MAKSKQFAKAPKKQKSKASEPVTADEFQEAADFEEDAGGKWRAGDPAKSGRAFVRALEIYDKGLQKFPKDFDLAYNKARLELEITQNPAIVAHIGIALDDLLRQTLESHRVALKLNEENVDVRFNASQVLMSLAEAVVEEGGLSEEAIGFLQQALEMLEGVLAKQEMMLEEHRAVFAGQEEGTEGDGGVSLDGSGSASASNTASTAGNEAEEQSATIVAPTTPNDLLDTVHASLSALTTLVSLVDPTATGSLGDMAYALTESKAPSYINLLPADAQDKARFATGLARATFVAAFADAQYSAQLIELQTYIERLQAFDLTGKNQDAPALVAEAQARSELVLSAIDQADGTGDFAADQCWKQLTLAQDSLTKASKLSSEEAKERKAKIYESKGDIEMLRYRLATTPGLELSEGVKKSSPTLLSNARTFYKGAGDHGKVLGEDDIVEKAKGRFALVNEILRSSSEGAGLSSSAGSAAAAVAPGPAIAIEDLMGVLEGCVEEGLVDMRAAQELADKLQGA